MTRYEYRVIDTGKDVEGELNRLGAKGWRVVGVTTKKQLLIAPPAAIILMRELEPASDLDSEPVGSSESASAGGRSRRIPIRTP